MKAKSETSTDMDRRRTYLTWRDMRCRCNNPNSPSYKWYGARGIKVCQRWNESFEAFLSDMGARPAGRSIDRINNDQHYTPENCRWATPTEQTRNRRVSQASGVSQTQNGKYRAYVYARRNKLTHQIHLGTFKIHREARAAVEQWRARSSIKNIAALSRAEQVKS